MTSEDAPQPARRRLAAARQDSTRIRMALARPPDQPSEVLRRIPVRSDRELILLPVGRIVLIAARRERLFVSTDDHAEYTLVFRLKDLERRLDPAQFVRLSRSLIVNVDAIARISPESSGANKVHLQNGTELQMSRNQAARLRRVVMDLLQ